MSDTNKQSVHFLDSIVESNLVNEDEPVKTGLEEQEDVIEKKSVLDGSEDDSEEEETEEISEETFEEEASEEEDEDFSFNPLVQSLIEDGIIRPNEGKEYDDDTEGFKDLIQDTAKLQFEEYKNSFVNDTSKKFIEFLESGGSADEFIQSSSEYPDYSKIDIDDEDNQKLMIREHYELLGWDENDIDSQIEELEEMGSLTKHSKTALKYLSKHRDEYLQGVIENQKQAEQARLQRLENEVVNIQKFIDTSENIAGLPVTKADRTKFIDYLTKPVKKDDRGNIFSRYSLEVTEEDKLKMAFLKYKNFDFSGMEAKIETRKTTELKKSLSKFKDTMSTKNNKVDRSDDSNSSKDKFPTLGWLS